MNKKNTKPPKIAEWILRRILPFQAGFTASGDYNELFHRIAEEEGISKARKWYWTQVWKSVLPFVINLFPWSLIMLKNYIKITFRNFKKHSIYSIINITGLSIGVACSILILLWVQNELSYDNFHENRKDLFKVLRREYSGDKIFHEQSHPAAL